MPRFCANLSMLFTEVPFLERFERAAEAGFEAVEIQQPYDFAAQDVRERLLAHRLRLVMHNLPAGDWNAGERGIACHPDRVGEFRAGVAQGIQYARALGASQLNCLAGKVPAGVGELVWRQTLVANLRHAAMALKQAGLGLLIEPINTFDVPGFCLNRSAQAIDLLGEIGADNASVQLDLYHAHRMDDNPIATLRQHLPRIGHIQLADHPGRHEPGTGEINFAALLAEIDPLGYRGWVGCEYQPAAGTEAGLGWLHAFQRPSAGAPGRTG